MDDQRSSFYESATNQYISDLCEDIPQYIKDRCKNPQINIDLEREVEEVAKRSLIKKTGMGYEVPGTPDAAAVDKQRRKKNYIKKQFIKEIREDYRQALSGQAVMKLQSPFAESAIIGKIGHAGSRIEAVESIYKDGEKGGIEGYLLRLEKHAPVRTGVEGFTGFTQYKYFDLIEGSDERAVKYVKIDIEEYLYRLSFEEKYIRYATYLPEKFVRGFYSEKPRRGEIRDDVELREMGEAYLHRMFFPDEVRPIRVSISSLEPWTYEDEQILSYIITKAIKSSAKNGGALQAEGGVTEIGTNVLGITRQKKASVIIEKRLRNIFETRLAVEYGGQITGKTIFDRYSLTSDKQSEGSEAKPGERRWWVLFGASVSADIISNRVYLSVKPQLDELEFVVSKALYPVFRRDRVTDFFLSGRKSHIYGYNALRFIFRVKESQKVKGVARYKEALEEMKKKDILIKDYFYDSESMQFMVDWIELTEEEEKDIRHLERDGFLEDEGMKE